MEILFESSYVRSREIAQDFYRYICFKRPFLMTFDILIGFCFFANIFFLIAGYVATTGALVVAPVFYALQIVQYLRAVNSMVKRDNEIANGVAITIDTIVTNEAIKCTSSNGSVNEISFEKIKKVITTKNLILLRSEAKLIYIFPKNSFTKGTADEFISFLSRKGLKLNKS